MDTEYIRIDDFCRSYEIEESFIFKLQEFELLTLRIIDEEKYMYVEELPKVEKLVRLHHDLNINLEGIGAIHFLLERTILMQEEIQMLKKRLQRHEER